MKCSVSQVAICSVLAAVWGCQRGPEPAKGTSTPEIEASKDNGQSVQTSLWLGGASGEPFCELNSTVPRPTASAIKAFFLIELFAANSETLDQPLSGTDAILSNTDHPALSHFNQIPGLRDTMKRELGGVSVRRIGEIMIGKVMIGKGDATSGYIYNAAANLTTAVLGGPEALTKLIRKRDPAFDMVSVRRYMLRDRKSPGDNEAPAAVFATLYRRLALRKLEGVNAKTMEAIREVLQQEKDETQEAHFAKAGSLPSDPLTEVRAGYRETAKGPLIYVVMVSQPHPGRKDNQSATQRLEKTADDLETVLTRAGRALVK